MNTENASVLKEFVRKRPNCNLFEYFLLSKFFKRQKLFFQVEVKADSLYLPLLKLAKEGNRLMSKSGFISFSCRPVEQVKPVAFTSEDSHVVSNSLKNHKKDTVQM